MRAEMPFSALQTRSNIFISDQTGLIPTQNRVYWLSWPSSAPALGGALVQFAARRRSWLVGLKGLIDDSLGLIVARKLIYAHQIGEGRTVQVVDDPWRAEGDNQ